jgi:hypothetical protein
MYSLNMALEVTEILCVTIFILGDPGGHECYNNSALLMIVKNLL